LDVMIWTSIDATDALDDFDVKVLIFQNNMWSKVVKVIKPFLQFLQAYDGHQVHNMLVIMFDPCFKSLKVGENYVGCGSYSHHTFEYDANAIIHFLMIIFEILTQLFKHVQYQLLDQLLNLVIS
jgi:hypothetical protein